MTATMAYSVIVACLLNILVHSQSKEVNGDDRSANLSVLLVSGPYVGHQFSMIALGEQLASRGHRVVLLAPTIEGSTFLTNLTHGVEFISAGVVNKNAMEVIAKMGTNSKVATFLRQLFRRDASMQWAVMLRKAVDRLDSSEWDYVVVDNVASVIMYYIAKRWKTDKVMENMSPLLAPSASSPPWPSPSLISGLKENMSFRERISNEMYHLFLLIVLPFVMRIPEAEEVLKLNEDYFSNAGVTHPVLLNTVLGFEYPRPLLPLMHYTGPLFMRSYPPLDPQLQRWLEDKENKSVVYISMGSMAELTPEQGRSILGGVMASPHNYSVVWALRQSNRNAIAGVKIDPKRTFISSWISQFTMLQHKTVAIAILHCGLGGVQEALYSKVPVICVPYNNDQFDIAARLEDWGLGIHVNSQSLNEKEVSNAVERVGSGEFDSKVEKMSIILRAPGGTKAAADLVELYAEVGHEHGVPATIKCKWSWVEYYNLDVYGFIVTAIGVFFWMSAKLLKVCCKVHYK